MEPVLVSNMASKVVPGIRSAIKGFSWAYVIVFSGAFAIVPVIFAGSLFPEYVSLLAKMTLLSVAVFLIALNYSFGFSIKHSKLVLNFDKTLLAIFFVFLFIILIILATAPRIPIIESLKGAGAEDLAQFREDFLKGRKGWETSLGYIVGTVNSYLLPYFIAVTFYKNHRMKYVVSLIFLFYSISFLEKAYFLKLAIPIFFIYYFRSKAKLLFLIKGFVVMCLLIFMMFILAGATGTSVTRDESFFSIMYTPGGTIESILWRSVVVPIVSSLDGVRVFITEFGGGLLYGKSSSFLALLTGREQVNFERALYQSQFGGSETGNANQFYVLEAYINFGMAGVALFSFLLGKIVRFAVKKNDLALLAVLPLLLFNLFNAGLIGNLLSNGLLVFLIFIEFVRLDFNKK